MPEPLDLDPVRNYFRDKLHTHGATHRGVDYNSDKSMEIRFDQLMRILDDRRAYTLLDWGSGYGAMLSYLLRSGHTVDYTGYDILEDMVVQGRTRFQDYPTVRFTSNLNALEEVDFSVVSGTFNMKLDATTEDWTALVLDNLAQINRLSREGFAFNLLTSYSDPEYMRSDLFYADPCFFFDYCKRNFSKNVALLHDYGLYDFTVLVRKNR